MTDGRKREVAMASKRYGKGTSTVRGGQVPIQVVRGGQQRCVGVVTLPTEAILNGPKGLQRDQIYPKRKRA